MSEQTTKLSDANHSIVIESTAPDFLHTKYKDQIQSRLTYKETAEKVKTSINNIFIEITEHNSAIRKIGYCPKCKRAGGNL